MSRSPTSPGLPIAVLAILATAFLGVPIVAVLAKSPWSDLESLLWTAAARDAFVLSVTTSTAASVVAAVLGFPLAWVLTRTAFPGRVLVRALVILPVVLPPVVGGVALLLAYGRRGLVGTPLFDLWGVQIPFTVVAVVLAQAFVAMPFLVLAVQAGIQTLDPGLEETAQTLGASDRTIMRKVILPQLRPALLAGFVLAWARALGEFGATITFAGNIPGRTRTLPLAVFSEMQRSPETAVALALPLLAVAVVVVALLRERWWPR